MRKYSYGLVNRNIIKLLDESYEKIFKNFIRSIYDIDIKLALSKTINLNRQLWVFPSHNNHSSGNESFCIEYSTRELKIENHISSEFNGKNIYQKFIIDRSKRTVFLITQAGELRQIIKAEYDKNLELIINTLSEESRNVVKVKKKGIFSALLSIFN